MGKETCPICGKEFGFLSPKIRWNSERQLWNDSLKRYEKGKISYRSDLHGRYLCFKCNKQLLDVDPLCSNCAFYKEHEEPFLDDTLTARRCGKFDFELTSRHYNQAKQCKHYIHKNEYKEKALKGEIAPSTSELVLKTCQYCETQFDLKKTSTCPKCGAS
jgi:hypothetical protein